MRSTIWPRKNPRLGIDGFFVAPFRCVLDVRNSLLRPLLLVVVLVIAQAFAFGLGGVDPSDWTTNLHQDLSDQTDQLMRAV